ncbi:MAG TPA: hypothetical protein V6C90_09205 [Coleofasciculaceae cyanobacterium]
MPDVLWGVSSAVIQRRYLLCKRLARVQALVPITATNPEKLAIDASIRTGYE